MGAKYYHQCPRCRGLNRYSWTELMAHYDTVHPGVREGEKP